VNSASFVTPAYGSRALSDVAPAIAAALGVSGAVLGEPSRALDLPVASAYVLCLIDGLGADLLRRYEHLAPFLGEAHLHATEGTASVPSTTATSLTSLGTALPPGAHGVVGYTSRVPATGRLLHALAWDKQVDPLEWQPHETAFAKLAAAGVAVTVINKRQFMSSGLTMAAQRGGRHIGADRAGERIAAATESVLHAPSFTYLYDSDLDWTGHRFGVGSLAWLQQLASIDSELEQLREALPGHVRMLVVADHGMVDCGDRVDIDESPALRDGVLLVGGEARLRHLYCRPGAVPDVVARWADLLGDRAVVCEREAAQAEGWFGEVSATVRPRLGDVVVAATGDTGIFSSSDFGYETSMIGLHGSMTAAEMLVPIRVY
jgi:hypothetical protein